MKDRIKKQNIPFTQISNQLLNDKNISLKAKGIYAFMYSKHYDFTFTINSMSKLLAEGQRSISRALNELKENGWVSYTKHSDGSGEYHLHIQPIDVEPKTTEKTENAQNEKEPNVQKRRLAKRTPLNKKELSNKKEIDFKGLLAFLNKTTGREFRTINKTVQGKYKARLKDGYKKEDIVNAIINASNVQSHRENGCQYLTPEFFSRSSTLDKYGFATSSTKKDSVNVVDKMEQGEFVNF